MHILHNSDALVVKSLFLATGKRLRMIHFSKVIGVVSHNRIRNFYSNLLKHTLIHETEIRKLKVSFKMRQNRYLNRGNEWKQAIISKTKRFTLVYFAKLLYLKNKKKSKNVFKNVCHKCHLYKDWCK